MEELQEQIPKILDVDRKTWLPYDVYIMQIFE
jgi:hypothetical protein